MKNEERAALAASTLVVTLLSVPPAAAVPIEITSGGFTSFTGQSAGTDGTGANSSNPLGLPSPGCDPGFQGVVAGAPLKAASCPPPGISGPASRTFSSLLSSVEFQQVAFGLPRPPGSTLPPGFGPAPANEIKFERPLGTQNVVDPTKDVFVLGKLTFTNGTWFGTGKVNSFHIEITANSSDASFGTQILSDDVVLDIRVGATAEENADCISFSQFVALQPLCAYEPDTPGKSNTVTADLMGRKGSLIAVEFINVQGGFLLGTAAIAEPTTLAILGLGLGGLALTRRRRV